MEKKNEALIRLMIRHLLYNFNTIYLWMVKFMGYKIDFNTYHELTTFIDYSKDLWTWGTQKFELSASNGMVMNIDTQSSGSGNSSGYQAFNILRPYIQQYYENNGSTPITLDIRLKCPESFMDSADPNNYYQAFFINFYSHNNIHYINLSYQENGANLIEAPYLAFVAYIKGLFDTWKTYYQMTYEE